MAQKWGVEINLGIFYLFIFFFGGGGQNTFLKNGSLHTKIPAHTLFFTYFCGGGTFSKKLGSQNFFRIKRGEREAKKSGGRR